MGLRVEAYVLFPDKTWDTVKVDRVFRFDETCDDFGMRQELFAEIAGMMPDKRIVDVGVYGYEDVALEPAPASGAHC